MGRADVRRAGGGKPFTRAVHPNELGAADKGLVSQDAAARNGEVRGAGRTKRRNVAGDGPRVPQ